ncbi:MAG: tyrosine-protein phosphatase [Pseudomonadota bacterium]
MSLKSRWRSHQHAWRNRWINDLDLPGARRKAWLDMNLVDHGIIRRFWRNRATLDRGVYRSNQPSPRQIRMLAQEGVRTIVNLRGANGFGTYALERETCAAVGIDLINFRLGSRRLPTIEEIEGLKEVFETSKRPLLIHCKSGADRAGMASALYVLAVMGDTAEEAQAHLSPRFLHFKKAQTGILDQFVQVYGAFNAHTPTPFMEWVHHHYDPEAIKAGFVPKGWADVVVDGLLRRE